jgi:hypothetical protein
MGQQEEDRNWPHPLLDYSAEVSEPLLFVGCSASDARPPCVFAFTRERRIASDILVAIISITTYPSDMGLISYRWQETSARQIITLPV